MAYTTNPNLPKVRREAINLVKYRKWSIRKVARHTGYSPSTVSRWCKHPLATGWIDIPTKSSKLKKSPRALIKIGSGPINSETLIFLKIMWLK